MGRAVPLESKPSLAPVMRAVGKQQGTLVVVSLLLNHDVIFDHRWSLAGHFAGRNGNTHTQEGLLAGNTPMCAFVGRPRPLCPSPSPPRLVVFFGVLSYFPK